MVITEIDIKKGFADLRKQTSLKDYQVMEDIRVLQFGGESLGSSEAINNVADLMSRENNGTAPVVIVSAMDGVNSSLDDIHNATTEKDTGYSIGNKTLDLFIQHMGILDELRVTDGQYTGTRRDLCSAYQHVDNLARAGEISDTKRVRLQAYGSLMAAFLLQAACLKRGMKSVVVGSSDFLTTDDSLSLDEERTKRGALALAERAMEGVVTIVADTGFSTPAGMIVRTNQSCAEVIQGL